MESVRQFLDRVNTMTNAAGTPALDFRVVVLGEKGCGKSTTLARLFGVTCLPCGDGNSTTRPIEVQLVNTTNPLGAKFSQPNNMKEWCECDHIPDRRMLPHEAKMELSAACLRQRDLSFDPLRVRFYSPNVTNITLVDLPGFGMWEGDSVHRPHVGVTDAFQRGVSSYLSHNLSVVLAFTHAPSGHSHLHSVTMAKENRAHSRAMTVVSGLDKPVPSSSQHAFAAVLTGRMPSHTFPSAVLEPIDEHAQQGARETVVELDARPFGIEMGEPEERDGRWGIPVVNVAGRASGAGISKSDFITSFNRSPIAARSTLEANTTALASMALPVVVHFVPSAAPRASHQPSQQLSKTQKLERWFGRLDAQLVEKITTGDDGILGLLALLLRRIFRDVAPTLKVRITAKLKALKASEQSLLNQSSSPSHGAHKALVMNVVTKISRNFSGMLDGGQGHSLQLSSLVGGARLVMLLDMFKDQLTRTHALQGLEKTEVAVAARNSCGTSNTLLVPQACFETLAKRQILNMLPHTMSTLEQVQSELLVIVDASVPKELEHFADLRRFVVDFVEHMVDERANTARKMIKDVFEMETAHINISHPDFARVYDQIYRVGGHGRVAEGSRVAHVEGSAPAQASAPEVGELFSDGKASAPAAPRPPQKEEASVFENLMGPSNEANKPRAPPKQQANSVQEGGKVMAGAAAVGALAGTLAVGPVIGVAAGIGAAASALRSDGIGNAARLTGRATVQMYERSGELAQAGSHLSNRLASAGSAMAQQYRAASARLMSSAPARVQRIEVPTAQELLDANQQACYIVMLLVEGYYNVVRTKIQDMVPKILFCFLIDYVRDHMESFLLQAVLSSPFADAPVVPSVSDGHVPGLLRRSSGVTTASQSVSSKHSEVHREVESLEHALQLLDECKQRE